MSSITVNPDGSVTATTGKVELGTGIRTALAQIVAEELDLSVDRVTLIMGDTRLSPDQGTTAGSKTIQTIGPLLRQTAARLRHALLARAAERLEIHPADLRFRDGVIEAVDDPSRLLTFADLAGEHLPDDVGESVPTKAPVDYATIGRSVPRVDLLAKLIGGEAYIHDLRLPGMLHGRVVRPHLRTTSGVGGAKVVALDDSEALIAPGVVAVVRNGSFVGVVAAREEQAVRAAELLQVIWSNPDPLPDQRQLFSSMPETPHETTEVVRRGEVEQALAEATVTLEATYEFASHAHASMGPSCAVADVRYNGATIYSASQGVFGLRTALAPILGLAPEQIHLIHREGSGCYGHNGADDVTADAALLSQAVGRPVRVQWTRQDEFAWEPKSPAMRSQIRAGLSAEGYVVSWDYQVWTPTHTTRPGGEPARLLAGELIDPPMPPAPTGRGGGDRNADHNYDFPNNRVTAHWLRSVPLRPGSLRSLGGMANTTANESFLDELAFAAGVDPVAFRLRHLSDPRAIEVIQRAADASGWEIRPPGPNRPSLSSTGPRRGRGISFARYEAAYAYVATVAEVEVDPVNGNVLVTRVVVAHDCGLIINPDGVRNQIEGNVIHGISRALKEEVTYNQTRVTSLDWSSYHILTFAEIPAIEIVLIDRPDEPPLGAGEPAICPMAAAIANAIFDATGTRLRTVPYTPARVLAAL